MRTGEARLDRQGDSVKEDHPVIARLAGQVKAVTVLRLFRSTSHASWALPMRPGTASY